MNELDGFLVRAEDVSDVDTLDLVAPSVRQKDSPRVVVGGNGWVVGHWSILLNLSDDGDRLHVGAQWLLKVESRGLGLDFVWLGM